MSSSVPNKRPSKLFLPIATIVLLLLVTALYLRSPNAEQPGNAPDDGLTYEQRIAPIVSNAVQVCEMIETNAPLEKIWNANNALEISWEPARTGNGYAPLRHDSLIIGLNTMISTLKSGELIWNAWQQTSDAVPTVPEKDRTGILFAIMAVHRAETLKVLLERTGMTIDQLMSRTNLAAEFKLSLKDGCKLSDRIAKAFSSL